MKRTSPCLAAVLSLTFLNQCVPATVTPAPPTPVVTPSPHVVYQDVSLACAQLEQALQTQGLSFREARAVRNYCLKVLRASRARTVARGTIAGLPVAQIVEESVADGRTVSMDKLPQDFRSYFKRSHAQAERMEQDYRRAFGEKYATEMTQVDLAILNEITQKNLAETEALNAAYPRAGRFFEGPFKVFNSQMGKVPHVAAKHMADINRHHCAYYAEQIAAIDRVLRQP